MKKLIIYFTILGLLSSQFLLFSEIAKADSVATGVTVEVIICGNDTVEEGESCDGSDLNGQTCTSLGYSGGGTLSCSVDCSFNTSNCLSAAPPPSGGGGGGFNVYVPETSVKFMGRAYPGSDITLLKDAQAAAVTTTGPDATFSITLSNLSAGNYIFSLYAEDYKGIRSNLVAFPVSVTAGATTVVSGIFIAPTIDLDKNEVKRGDNLAIFGQSFPNSEIIITVNSDQEYYAKVKTAFDGIYLYNFDTTPLEIGQHFTKAKASFEEEISGFSKVIGFSVGEESIFKDKGAMGDLNDDGKVNLVDFSIAAYWYGRTLGGDIISKEAGRLNGDGRIDLTDFSIMAYYWTG